MSHNANVFFSKIWKNFVFWGKRPHRLDGAVFFFLCGSCRNGLFPGILDSLIVLGVREFVKGYDYNSTPNPNFKSITGKKTSFQLKTETERKKQPWACYPINIKPNVSFLVSFMLCLRVSRLVLERSGNQKNLCCTRLCGNLKKRCRAKARPPRPAKAGPQRSGTRKRHSLILLCFCVATKLKVVAVVRSRSLVKKTKAVRVSR